MSRCELATEVDVSADLTKRLLIPMSGGDPRSGREGLAAGRAADLKGALHADRRCCIAWGHVEKWLTQSRSSGTGAAVNVGSTEYPDVSPPCRAVSCSRKPRATMTGSASTGMRRPFDVTTQITGAWQHLQWATVTVRVR